jgi:ATP-binding cassette subfamily F protein uup
MIIIDAQGLAASRPNRPLFADVSITISDGDRVGVVGINGCGKSTLLRMISGEIEPQAGVVRRGRGSRIGVLGQNPVLASGTVREAVITMSGCESSDVWKAEAMLDRLGMAALIDRPSDQLSGGQRKRVALAALLAGEWEALILDEPTNHLDLDAIRYLEEWLAAYTGGLLLVTHDRHVLDRVTTKVLEIDRGHGYLHVPTGWNAGSGYAAYLAGRVEREEQAAVAEQVRRNLARTELAWLRRGAPARTSKPKARIAAATKLIETKADGPAREGDLGLNSSERLGARRLGSKGIEMTGVAFSWPGKARVLDAFDLVLEPGDRIGIVGPNGAGKSTMLELIAGRLEPSAGTIDVGRTVRIGYYDQIGRELDTSMKVRDAVAGDKGAPSIDDVTLMKRFWFDGDAQFAEISTLSGGERRRLQLLLTLLEQPNVLLLDEPTNDLDLDTLRALEDFLDDWPGIVVVVSHDRAFLDRTVSDVLALDGEGDVRPVRGGVAGWLASRTNQPSPTGRGSVSNRTPVSKTPSVAVTNAPVVASTNAAKSVLAKSISAKSPSTLKRLLAQSEKALDLAITKRDAASAELSSVAAGSSPDHARLAALSEQLAAAQTAVDVAEETWIEFAAEVEARGISLDERD